MKFNIIGSNSLYCGFEKVLEKLDFNYKNNLFEKHIVIVPDKFTLNAEKRIFEKLHIDCFFNIEVVTISNLCASILNGVNKTVLSKQASVMLINNLLHKNIDKLKTFKNSVNFNGFSENLFETISQFKSCEVLAENINFENFNELTKLKLEDIKYIYEEYENHLKKYGLWDNFDKLKIATTSIKKNQYNNTAFYFAYFNSLTAEQLSFVKNIIVNSGEVNFACAYTKNQLNKHIYSKELFNSLTNLTKQIPNIFLEDINANKNIEHILKNLFAVNFEKRNIEDGFINLFECQNIEDEIEHIAKIIKNKIVFDGKLNTNFAVLCADFENYKSSIKNIFKNFELPVFFDESICLNEHFFAKYVLNVLQIVFNNFEQNDVINYSKSYFSDLSINQQNSFENIVLKFGIKNNMFKTLEVFEKTFDDDFEDVFNMIAKLTNLQNEFKNAKSVKIKINILKNFLTEQESKEKINCAIKNFNTENNLVWQKFTEEVFDRVENIFNEIEKTFDDIELKNEEFFNIIESGFKSIKLNLVPTAVDNIFVGDINSSFILPVDVLFVVGASENNLPLIKSDCGILIDAELNEFKQYKIEPTIREINKRIKFLEFQQLLNAKENLIFTFSSSNSKEQNSPSIFIKNLQYIFEFNNLPLPIIKTKLLETDLNTEGLDKYFCAGVFNKKMAYNFLAKNKDNFNNYECNEHLLNKLKLNKNDFKPAEFDNLDFNENDNKLLFFDNNKISASQLESYFSCPYKHFYNYGIKPIAREKADMQPMEIGSLLHLITNKFIKNYNKQKLTNDELINLANKYYEESIIELKMQRNFENNKFFIKSIKEEAVRLINTLYFERQNSDFNNYGVETRFEQKNTFDNLTFKGFVDRIDVFDNYFRIIDYKSIAGNSSSSIDLSLKKLYNGEKLQLFLYAGAMEKILKKELAGVFYFPIKNTFTLNSQDNQSSVLSGYFLNENNILTALDKTENQLIVKLVKSNTLTKDQLHNLEQYAFAISTNAICEILKGNIMPSPTGTVEKNSCTYCEFKSMCDFNYKNGLRKIIEKIDIQFFESVNKNGK